MCQKYVFKKAYYNSKLIHMQELDEFCNQYLPLYFALKYKDGNIKEPYFNFKSQDNVFELTSKIFSMIEHLHAANPFLQISKIIHKYFMFEISDFQLSCKDIRVNEEDQGRQSIRRILKKMNKLNRQSFQIFLRLIYLYFDSKQTVSNPKRIQTRKEYIEQISILYIDLKFKAMTDDDSFVPMEFMQYIIRLLLKMKPTQKFNKIILNLIKQCDFSEHIQQSIEEKIKTIQEIQNLKKIHETHKNKFISSQDNKVKILFEQDNGASKKLNFQVKNKINSKEKNQKNENTPIKQKSANKIQQKTLESSEKKQNITQRKIQDQNTLQSLKVTLMLHKKANSSIKQRTLYMRSKFLIPKKTQYAFDQNSSTGSNNQNDELFLMDLNRNFSSRCIDVKEYEEGDFLVGATPKPKKKLKMDKTYSGTFDDKGNFKKGC